jgi:two-component system, NtrC family, response regulator AtoC
MAAKPSDQETIQTSGRTDGFCLRVLFGDQVIVHALPPSGAVRIGRHESCDLKLDSTSVSRQHARITIEQGVLSIADLESANGTFIREERLTPGLEVPLQPGDAVEIGGVVLLVQRDQPSPASVARQSLATDSSEIMQKLNELIGRVAPGLISVLIVGETGVGKEVIAERIHRQSRRASKPFVRFNCAAITEQLLESEWFGYERGAFTGAVTAKAGLIESAEGGTVLLDEIGELPIGLQAKLLRVLEERVVQRVGALKPRPIDVRFLAATNRVLEHEIEARRFREDLYFRLNGITLHIPPLRERRDEIAQLAQQFIEVAARTGGRKHAPTLAASALVVLQQHDWPGNVRELRNTMDRAVLLADDVIDVDVLLRCLRSSAAGHGAKQLPTSQSMQSAVANVEKERVLAALAEARGNQTRAAEILGIARGTLLGRLDAFGIPRPRKGG